MKEQKRDCLKITVPRELALDCQRVLETQGVPLNVTQAVKAMLTFAVQSKTQRADHEAKRGRYGTHQINHRKR